jgi:hypothetical protein
MKLSPEYNLSTVRPELAKEWHHTRNSITPDQILPNSNKKAWWVCPEGHEWEATVAYRSQHLDCPYCKRERPTAEYSLQSQHPDIAKYWHPAKNGSLTPDQILPYSNKKAWWVCPKGHEWEARIDSVATRTGCPHCAGFRSTPRKSLATLHPELVREWHPTKNGVLLPEDTGVFSIRRVWWVCEKGHEWIGRICSRSKGVACPLCNSLQVRNPELASQWHPERNGDVTPSDVTPFSHAKRWWLCKYGHEWEATVNNRAQRGGCPICAGRIPGSLESHNPLLALEWHPTRNGNLTPKDVKPGSNKKVWWKCKKGHEWQATVKERSHGNGCRRCSGRGRKPKMV